jgi:hypothetical protein
MDLITFFVFLLIEDWDRHGTGDLRARLSAVQAREAGVVSIFKSREGLPLASLFLLILGSNKFKLVMILIEDGYVWEREMMM